MHYTTSIRKIIKMCQVSVLMPTCNHEPYIGTALDSILEQDFNGQIEIHVFDDHSEDRTTEITTN